MAYLDQMNVKANESDTQGTDYDIRDRKLTTATGQQGVNTSDVVLLKDTSGNYHEITKDSFMSAVRGALGSLIKSYDKGTAINGVAVTGSTGTVNDLGFSSPADLASVLGVVPNYQSVRGDGTKAYKISDDIGRYSSRIFEIHACSNTGQYKATLTLYVGTGESIESSRVKYRLEGEAPDFNYCCEIYFSSRAVFVVPKANSGGVLCHIVSNQIVQEASESISDLTQVVIS